MAFHHPLHVTSADQFSRWPAACQEWLRENLTWAEMQVFLWDEPDVSCSIPAITPVENKNFTSLALSVHEGNSCDDNDDECVRSILTRPSLSSSSFTLIPPFHCPIASLNSTTSTNDPLSDSLANGGDKLLKLIASEFAKMILLRRNEMEAVGKYEKDFAAYERALNKHNRRKQSHFQFDAPDKPPAPPSMFVQYEEPDTGELTRIVANLKTNTNWVPFLRRIGIDSVSNFERIAFCVAERTCLWRAELWLKWYLRSEFPTLFADLPTAATSPQPNPMHPLSKFSPYHFPIDDIPELVLYVVELHRSQQSSSLPLSAADSADSVVKITKNDVRKAISQYKEIPNFRVGGGGVTTAGRLFIPPFSQILPEVAPILDLSRTIASMMPSVGFSEESLRRLEILLGEMQRYGVWFGEEPCEEIHLAEPDDSNDQSIQYAPLSLPIGCDVYYDPKSSEFVPDNQTLGGFWTLAGHAEASTALASANAGIDSLALERLRKKNVAEEDRRRSVGPSSIFGTIISKTASADSFVANTLGGVVTQHAVETRDQQRLVEMKWCTVNGGRLAYVPIKYRQRHPIIISGGEGCGTNFPAFLTITVPEPLPQLPSSSATAARTHSNEGHVVVSRYSNCGMEETDGDDRLVLIRNIVNRFLFSPQAFDNSNVQPVDSLDSYEKDTPMKKCVRETFLAIMKQFESRSIIGASDSASLQEIAPQLRCTVDVFSFFDRFMRNGNQTTRQHAAELAKSPKSPNSPASLGNEMPVGMPIDDNCPRDEADDDRDVSSSDRRQETTAKQFDLFGTFNEPINTAGVLAGFAMIVEIVNAFNRLHSALSLGSQDEQCDASSNAKLSNFERFTSLSSSSSNLRGLQTHNTPSPISSGQVAPSHDVNALLQHAQSAVLFAANLRRKLLSRLVPQFGGKNAEFEGQSQPDTAEDTVSHLSQLAQDISTPSSFALFANRIAHIVSLLCNSIAQTLAVAIRDSHNAVISKAICTSGQHLRRRLDNWKVLPANLTNPASHNAITAKRNFSPKSRMASSHFSDYGQGFELLSSMPTDIQNAYFGFIFNNLKDLLRLRHQCMKFTSAQIKKYDSCGFGSKRDGAIASLKFGFSSPLLTSSAVSGTSSDYRPQSLSDYDQLLTRVVENDGWVPVRIVVDFINLILAKGSRAFETLMAASVETESSGIVGFSSGESAPSASKKKKGKKSKAANAGNEDANHSSFSKVEAVSLHFLENLLIRHDLLQRYEIGNCPSKGTAPDAPHMSFAGQKCVRSVYAHEEVSEDRPGKKNSLFFRIFNQRPRIFFSREDEINALSLIPSGNHQHNIRRHWFHMYSNASCNSSPIAELNAPIQIQTTRALSQPAPPRTAFYLVGKPSDVNKIMNELCSTDVVGGIKLYDRTAFVTLIAPEAIFRFKEFYASQLSAIDNGSTHGRGTYSNDTFAGENDYDYFESDDGFINEYVTMDEEFEDDSHNEGAALFGNENRPFSEIFACNGVVNGEQGHADFTIRPTFIPTHLGLAQDVPIESAALVQNIREKCKSIVPKKIAHRPASQIPQNGIVSGYIADYVATTLTNPIGQCDEKLKNATSVRFFEVDLYALVKDKHMVVRQLPDRANPPNGASQTSTMLSSRQTAFGNSRPPTPQSPFGSETCVEGHYIAMPTDYYSDKTGLWFPADYFTGRQIEISQGSSSNSESPTEQKNSKGVKVEFVTSNALHFYFADDESSQAQIQVGAANNVPLVPLRKFSRHLNKLSAVDKRHIFGHRMLRRELVSQTASVLDMNESETNGEPTATVESKFSESNAATTICFAFSLDVEGYKSIIRDFSEDSSRTQLWLLFPKRLVVSRKKEADSDHSESDHIDNQEVLRWCKTMDAGHYKKMKFIRSQLRNARKESSANTGPQEDDDSIPDSEIRTIGNKISIPREYDPSIPIDIVTPENAHLYRPAGMMAPITMDTNIGTVTYVLGANGGGNIIHRTNDLKNISSDAVSLGLRYQEITYKSPPTAKVPSDKLPVSEDGVNEASAPPLSSDFICPKNIHEWYTVVLITKKVNFKDQSIVGRIAASVLGITSTGESGISAIIPPSIRTRHNFSIGSLFHFQNAITRSNACADSSLVPSVSETNQNSELVVAPQSVTAHLQSRDYELLEFTGDTLLDYITVRDAIVLSATKYSRVDSGSAFHSSAGSSGIDFSYQAKMQDILSAIKFELMTNCGELLGEHGNIATDVCNNDVLSCLLPFELKRQVAIEESGGNILNNESTPDGFGFQNTVDPYRNLLLSQLGSRALASIKDGPPSLSGPCSLDDPMLQLPMDIRNSFTSSLRALERSNQTTAINSKTKADMLEALFGAVYEDGHGLDGIRKMCFSTFSNIMSEGMLDFLVRTSSACGTIDASLYDSLKGKLLKARRSPHTISSFAVNNALLKLNSDHAIRPNASDPENAPPANTLATRGKNNLAGISNLCMYMFTPFDCHTVIDVKKELVDSLSKLLLRENLDEAIASDDDDHVHEESLNAQRREAYLRGKNLSDAEIDALRKTSGGIVFYITANSHGASSGYSRIQDKSYATHFTTGSVYSYRRAEHYLYAAHLTNGGGGFSGNASSGCLLPLSGVLRSYFYGDVSFQNETIVLSVNSDGLLSEGTVAATSLILPKRPSKPFVPFTIDFDGMAITRHGVDAIITKYLCQTFYMPFGVARPPIGGVVLDCTGQTQRKINGEVKIKYKHSCHVHFPSIVMSLDGLEYHTNLVREFVLSEKLANYRSNKPSPESNQRCFGSNDSQYMPKPGDAVVCKEDASLYICLLSSQWASWIASNGRAAANDTEGDKVYHPNEVACNTTNISVGGQNRNFRHQTGVLGFVASFCDELTLAAMCFVCERFQFIACTELGKRYTSDGAQFAFLRKMLIEKGDFNVKKIVWNPPPSICKSHTPRDLLGAASVHFWQSSAEKNGVGEPFRPVNGPDDISDVVGAAATHRTELFKNIKEKILEKNPNTEHFWNKVIDTGLVVSKKLRMYLCDKYDQTYDQEFRPLQFERFLPFAVAGIESHSTPQIIEDCLSCDEQSDDDSDHFDFDCVEHFGYSTDTFTYPKQEGLCDGVDSHADLSDRELNPFVSVPHDQVLSMSSLQRPKIFDVHGNQHFVDSYRKSNVLPDDSTSVGNTLKRDFGFNPMLPTPAQMISLGALNDCKSSDPSTTLNAMHPLVQTPPASKSKEAVTKYAGIHPSFWVCSHHTDPHETCGLATIALFIGGQPTLAITLKASRDTAEETLISSFGSYVIPVHAATFSPHVSVVSALSDIPWRPKSLHANQSVCFVPLHVDLTGAAQSASDLAKLKLAAAAANSSSASTHQLDRLSIPIVRRGMTNDPSFSFEFMRNKTKTNSISMSEAIAKIDSLAFVSLETESQNNKLKLSDNDGIHQPGHITLQANVMSDIRRLRFVSLHGCDYFSFQRVMTLLDRKSDMAEYVNLIAIPLLSVFFRLVTREGSAAIELNHTSDMSASNARSINIALVCFSAEAYNQLADWLFGTPECGDVHVPYVLSSSRRAFLLDRENRQTTHIINMSNEEELQSLRSMHDRRYDTVILVDNIPLPSMCSTILNIAAESVVSVSDSDASLFSKQAGKMSNGHILVHH